MKTLGFCGEPTGEPPGNCGEVKEDSLTYWFEKQAQQNEPMPDNLTEQETLIYSFLRNLYWSLDHKIISTEQAQREKNIMEKLIDKGKKEREFERKCWENSARRTMASERAVTMYGKNRTLENADRLCEAIDGVIVRAGSDEV